MKVTRFINGKIKEKDELNGMKVSNELISSTIENVNKRQRFDTAKGMNVTNE